MVQEAHNTNLNKNNPPPSSKVSSHHDKLPCENYAIESPRDIPPLPPNSFRDKRDNKESMNNAASQPSQQLPPMPPTSQIQPSVTPDHQGEKPDIFSTLRRDTRNNKESMNNNASQPSKQPPSQPSQLLLPLSPTSQIQPSVTPDHQGEKADIFSTFWDTFDNKESMNNNASQPSKQPPSEPSQLLLPLSPTSQIQPSVTPDHRGEKADIFSTFWDTFDNKESMNNNASQPSKQPPSEPSQLLLPLSPTSQIQPSVTPDIFSSSQTLPSKNNGTKTSTNISDPSASSSSTAGFLTSFGTIPLLVETTKPSSLTRPLTAATAKTSSPATLYTASTSRPSRLPGDTENGTIP
jgi:hypothetical protein